MAPEQIEKKLYFISVDIWSIGILMFMLLNNGKHPFYVKGINKTDFSKKIENCKINFYNKVSPMAKHLIFKLLEPNPSWRYTAAQALKHPWITRNKNDEVPLTFNEILNKSNMKKVGRGILGSLIFLNFITKKKKYMIDNKYIQVCSYYDERAKLRDKKKIEKCLDILSTNDGDDSDNDYLDEKEMFVKRNLSEKTNILVNSVQNSFAISATHIMHKIIKNKAINLVGSIKKIKGIKKINKTDKKKSIFKFKKMDYQLNLFSTRKRADSLSKNNNISNNNNTYRDNFIKIRINPKNEKKNEIMNRNIYKNKNKLNTKDLNNSKSLKIINNPKNSKFNNEYFEEKKINKKELPDINFLLKKNETLSKNFFLNESENSNMFPLVLPNINLIKKEKALKKCIKKVLISKVNKFKNS
jgi:serine/threonine protein kinase